MFFITGAVLADNSFIVDGKCKEKKKMMPGPSPKYLAVQHVVHYVGRGCHCALVRVCSELAAIWDAAQVACSASPLG